MQCKCGANITPREHNVTTLKGAWEWLPDATSSEIPLHVIQWECGGCGRYRANVLTYGDGRMRTLPEPAGSR